jgi:hypothetical protein
LGDSRNMLKNIKAAKYLYLLYAFTEKYDKMIKIKSEMIKFLLFIVLIFRYPVKKSITNPKNIAINISILFFSLAIYTLL